MPSSPSPPASPVGTNWAGNVRFTARNRYRPAGLAELKRLVAGSDRIRALGTGHSFSTVADTSGDLVSLAGLPPLCEIDSKAPAVRVSAGLTYAQLAAELQRHGLALRNLASLPHIGIAGAVATGTHGSGNSIGSLSTAVSAIEMVTADGDIVTLARRAGPGSGNGSADFDGAVVALGLLGIVTSLTLDLVPAFEVSQFVYDDVPLVPAVLANTDLPSELPAIFSAGYSVSVFTTWAAPVAQVWVKRLAADGEPRPAWHGGHPADGPRHPIPGMPAGAATQQLGVPGPWHQRLPHFRPDWTPSAGRELQTEYLVPRDQAAEAVTAVSALGGMIGPVVQVSELRTVAADELWLSPAYGRDTLAIHFTWVDDISAVGPVIAALDSELAPLAARPHWGKLFATSPHAVQQLYPRLADFRRLVHRWDPAGTFGNDFTATYVTGEEAGA